MKLTHHIPVTLRIIIAQLASYSIVNIVIWAQWVHIHACDVVLYLVVTIYIHIHIASRVSCRTFDVARGRSLDARTWSMGIDSSRHPGPI